MEIKDWFSVLAIIVSFGSLTIAALSYRRNRRIDSENLLFKYKSEGYVVLIEKLATIMDRILEEQKYLGNLVIDNSEELKRELNDRAEKFDVMVGDFANDVIKHSLFFSKEINTELDSFSDFLYDTHGGNQGHSLDDTRKQLEKHYNDFLLKADYLFELMRKDLHVDQLNTSLARRLKGARV